MNSKSAAFRVFTTIIQFPSEGPAVLTQIDSSGWWQRRRRRWAFIKLHYIVVIKFLHRTNATRCSANERQQLNTGKKSVSRCLMNMHVATIHETIYFIKICKIFSFKCYSPVPGAVLRCWINRLHYDSIPRDWCACDEDRQRYTIWKMVLLCYELCWQ